jgi:hypothetical protein
MRIKLEKDKAPFKAPIQIYSVGGIVTNPYSKETARLNALELSIYDTIKGCEQFEDYENVRLGLDWFMKFNPTAYMILLD